MKSMSARILQLVSLTLFTLILFGCGSEPAPVAPPPPEVTVSKPEKREVIRSLNFTGTISAFQKVEIRARVQGFLEKINFTPGAFVNEGTLLFVIDPRPYQAKVDQATATMEAKKASLYLAQVEYDKARQLESKDAISQIKLIEQTAKRDVARAELAQAEADLQAASLDLEYTQVKTPISGNVARNLVDLGSLVGAQEKTLLTTVVNDKSVYVYFSASEQDLMPLIRDENKAPERNPKLFIGLSDEKDYPHEGHIDYADPEIDPSTGTLQIRGVFTNEKGLFVPGMFVRVKVPVQKIEAVLVPDIAIQSGQGGKFVLVVNDKKIVEQRMIQTGQLDGRMRVILEGLKENEWVIVNGIRRARPGEPVNPIQEKSTSAQLNQSAPADKNKK
ncbi:MAG: efflux RND transporter periplasmic adaptor subunit [Syntrophaceae bacterium]|nr:efflux RND transporter periplasmic adaptor subunit [Syntrophaceae bacterium]